MTYRWMYTKKSLDQSVAGPLIENEPVLSWLNALGEQGWELVDIERESIGWPAPGVVVFRHHGLFKRCGALADPMAARL